MQRKEIEKIPYLKAKSVKDDNIKYVAAADVKMVKSKKIFILEIYANCKSKLSVPIVRICLSKDDYENYYPAENKWSKKKIKIDYYHTEILGKYMALRVLESELHFNSDVKNKLYKFLPTDRTDNLINLIAAEEDNISSKKERQKDNNIQKKIKELVKNAPEHTETFFEWAKTTIPQNYMYYLRKNNTAFLTCTHCGNREKYFTGQPVSLEDYARKYIDVPKVGAKCVCEFCNAHAEYKQEGHYGGSWETNSYVYDIQNNNGKAVITLVKVKKIYTNGEAEQYEFKDLIKAVYSEGRKTADKVYKPQNTWTNTNGKFGWGGWDNEHISESAVKSTQIYGVGNLKGTSLQYSGMKEFLNGRLEVSPIKYADIYLKHKELEMLAKMGLWGIAERTINQGRQIVDGKKPHQMLGIYPERLPMLIKAKGEYNTWRILKCEHSLNVRFSDENIKKIKSKIQHLENIKTCLGYMTYTKFENYMGKQKWNINEYADYLELKSEAGYNMKDLIILFPADLHRAHQQIVDETNMVKAQEKMIEKNKSYANIAKNYKKLNAKFGYKTDEFIIRPVKDAAEIIREGQLMYHCVGSSDTYMRRHNDGESYILLLRKVSEPDMPYCTIEIKPDFKISQWYQAFDKKTDETIIAPLLDEYLQIKSIKAKAM